MATNALSKPDQAITQLNEKLAALIKRGEAIRVTDQASDVLAKQFKIEVKSYEKAVELYADGNIQDAKERLSKLQTAKKMLLAPAFEILNTVELSRKEWEETERQRAEAEERRLNEERHKRVEAEAEKQRQAEMARIAEEKKARDKEIADAVKAGEVKKREAERMRKEAEERAAEEREQAAKEAKEAAANVPQYRVKPAIEHVPGTKSQRNYKFKIVRPSIIPRAYLMPDEVAIGRMVRDKKDKILAETECPGIEVWSE